MLIERRKIENGLLGKGFIKDNKDHRIFRLIVDGKITCIKTLTSHGSKYKDYGDSLLNLMKKELRLESKSQLIKLINCALEYRDYVSYLKVNNIKL